jgi:hypothetical protein
MYKQGFNEENCAGNECFEGFCIDLLTKLQDEFRNEFGTKFIFTIDPAADKKFGVINESGHWNGMIGELLNHVRTFTRILKSPPSFGSNSFNTD